MTYYKKIKKNVVDVCNICGNTAKLSWEHVPPKSCDNKGAFLIDDIFNVEHINLKLDSQNGIKYRTICEKCNNEILGSNVDIDFQDFYIKVKDCLTHGDIRNPLRVQINIVNVLKCLFGKMLAMDEIYCTDEISNAMRSFILENKKNEILHVYFWIYPYNTCIQTRNQLVTQVEGVKYSTNGMISVLYYYPLAFIVSGESEKELAMVDLMDYADFINPIVSLKIHPIATYNPRTGKILPYNWLAGTEDEYGNQYLICTTKNNTSRICIKK